MPVSLFRTMLPGHFLEPEVEDCRAHPPMFGSEAAALADTVERLLRGLEPLERRLVELRLQGWGLGGGRKR